MTSVGRSVLTALGAGIELAFRAIPRALGRRIGAGHAWLWGPIGPDGPVGPGHDAALAGERGLVLEADDAQAGLLPDFAALRGPTFDPDRIDPRIRHLYEHTASFRLVVAARWSPLFLTLGSLLVGAVSRHIGRLNFPLDAHGATSRR